LTPLFFGVKNIPTLRSLFSFEHFEEVLQKLAHRIAIDAITNPQGDIRIDVHNGRMSLVETNRHTIRFYANHVTYEEWSRKYTDGLGFDVEEKLYTTSNHCTKISYYAPEGKTKKTAEKITSFIDKIMAEASIKPVPRFTLKNRVS